MRANVDAQSGWIDLNEGYREETCDLPDDPLLDLTESAIYASQRLLDFFKEGLSLVEKCPLHIYGGNLSAADVRTGFDALARRLKTRENDRIALEELETALGDPSIKGGDAQILCVLKKHFSRIAMLDPSEIEHPQSISRKAIAVFDLLQKKVKSGLNKNEAAVSLVKDVDCLMVEMRKCVVETVRRPFADVESPLASIRMECVKQGPIGNCYFYGAVGAVLSVNPSAIREMITDNGDGTYSVTFPGKDRIEVAAPSDAELFLFPKPGTHGTWMWILEKAYGQLCMESAVSQKFHAALGRAHTLVPQEHTWGPGVFDEGLRVMTGKSTEWVLNFNKKAMAEALEKLFDERPRRAITADATVNIKTGDGAPIWGHTYSVIDYNKAERTVTLRNPWGERPPAVAKDLGDGRFSMKVDDFCNYFNRISFPRKADSVMDRLYQQAMPKVQDLQKRLGSLF